MITSGLLASLLPVVISAIIAALGKLALDLQGEQEAYRRGAADTGAATTKETVDADRRASQAQADAPRGSRLDDELVAGRVQF